MSRPAFLTLAAIIALSVGCMALLFPTALLNSKGVVLNAAANVWAREVGVALVAIAVMAFLMRGQPDSPTMKAFLLGNAVLQLGLLPIEILAFIDGTLPKVSGIVPNSIVHGVLAAAFLFYASRVQLELMAGRGGGPISDRRSDSGS